MLKRLRVNIVALGNQQLLHIVCVALVTQHTKRMRRIVLSSVGSGFTIFLHIISQKALFLENSKNRICVLFFCTTCVYNISHSKKK
jgi:hypothetical protein